MSEKIAEKLLPNTAQTAAASLALYSAFGLSFLITFVVGSTTSIATTLIAAFAPTLLAFGAIMGMAFSPNNGILRASLEKGQTSYKHMNNKDQEKKKLAEILANPLKKNESGENAQKILDNHIGFPREKAKFASDAYLYAAVEDGKYKSEKEIFCYDGKPGTGKTTFIKTLNRAMGRGELQIISLMLKSGCKNPIIPLDELEKISDEQVQRDLIELFKMYKNEGKGKSKKLFDKYFQMDIELDYITFFATVNYSDQLVPALKKEVEMRKLEDYSDEDKEKILELKKKEIEDEIKKIYPDEKKEIIPQEIIKILPKYINEKGIRQTERVLFKIKKEYIEARENGRDFSLGDPKE
ncbi:2070_t:CDS:2 [Cetraspora pellucida]|uniref:2070_t:CDS:1 n=2 Tax=Cetraspora pellucida TaxID=1433469 RepID=A0ACA9JXY8_9GLOM|nr:2057_t:CDS:2 [Cetraspora pellucida]CAG8439726.1 2070_t:CDS:2 [Cetraspora pellucida]